MSRMSDAHAAGAADPGATRIGIADVKPLLNAQALRLIQTLVPGGHNHGRYIVAPNPRRQEKHGGSFVIFLDGGRIFWKEHDAGDSEKGDALDLIIYCGQARDTKEALAWAKDWLGLSGRDAPAIKQLAVEAKAHARKAEADASRKREKRIKFSRAIYLNGAPVSDGDPVWNYLSIGRGIPVEDLLIWQQKNHPKRKSFLGAIRCAPELDYLWPSLDVMRKKHVNLMQHRPSNGKTKLPAMVAAFSPVSGGVQTACHRTYLKRDGLAKASLPSAKRMLGVVGGCTANVWHGATGLAPLVAAKQGKKGPVVLTEGIEDALAIAVSAPELRCLSVGTLGNLLKIDWPPCASELTIFADNDWQNAAAQKAMEAAARRLAAFGPVKIAKSPHGNDANDLLQKGAI